MASKEDIFHGLQLLMQDSPVSEALPALVDAMAGVVAFAANDRPHADVVLDTLRGDLGRAVDRYWVEARSWPRAKGSA
jgi:hypothetical protein